MVNPDATPQSEDALLADIGGTNARFAWQSERQATLDDIITLKCADHLTLADAIKHYLDLIGRSAPSKCAIAVACPVSEGRAQMTNHHWCFSITTLKSQFGFTTLRVLNDFTALALSLPHISPEELDQIGGGIPESRSSIGLIGPGTGLGVSGMIPCLDGNWIPLQSEGGHVTLASSSDREQEILSWLSTRYGHVSAERAVCGQGLVDIHRALQFIDCVKDISDLNAAGVTSAALDRNDSYAWEAIELFCGFLGTVAGNLALTLGAKGGIYIGGGIVPKLGDAFKRTIFRQRFEAKGRFTEYLAEIPVYVIQSKQSPALLGAALALQPSQ